MSSGANAGPTGEGLYPAPWMKDPCVREHDVPSHSTVVLTVLNLYKLIPALSLSGGLGTSVLTSQITLSR